MPTKSKQLDTKEIMLYIHTNHMTGVAVSAEGSYKPWIY
jgi:hypothetical protein